MITLLHTPTIWNTDKEPILFIDKIISCDYIKLAKEYFYNEHKEEHSLLRSYPVKVDERQEKITVSFEKEINWDEYTGPVNVWEDKDYLFSDILKNTLRFHIIDSQIRLDKKATNEKHLEKSKKESFKEITKKITERYYEIRTDPKFAKYRHIFSKHLSQLLGQIYFKHPSFAPKKNKEINNLLELSESGMLSLEPYELAISVFESITVLQLRPKSTRIFYFARPDDAKKKYKYFHDHQPDKMLGPIKFLVNTKHISATYYLISRLAFYLGYNESDLNGKTIFTINGRAFSANSAYTAKNRMKKRANTIKVRIDELFFHHLS